MNEVDAKVLTTFIRECGESVTQTAQRVGDTFDIEEATNEAVKAVLTRYQRTHPGLFTSLMKTKTVNTCFCGQCREAILISYNRPLALLVREVAGG